MPSDPPDEHDWQDLAAKELRGTDPDALVWDTPEGIAVKPLYTAADLEDLETVGGLPGFEPFVRGVRATMYANRPWTIRQYAGLLHRRGVERVLPRRTSRPGRWACRSRSTSRRTAATTATTRASSATSARPASRSTRSRT